MTVLIQSAILLIQNNLSLRGSYLGLFDVLTLDIDSNGFSATEYGSCCDSLRK